MDFYEKCANILGVSYEGEAFTHYRRTRWNNRNPGRGRYPGFGIIRKFNDSYIHVMLTRPVYHNKVYSNENEVFKFLESIV